MAVYAVNGAVERVWTFGVEGDTRSRSTSIDEISVSDGQILVAGVMMGTGVDLDPRLGSTDLQTISRETAFMVAFDASTGTPAWTNTLQSEAFTRITGVHLAESGGYVTGTLGGDLTFGGQRGETPVTIDYDGTLVAPAQAFVGRFDSQGQAVWAAVVSAEEAVNTSGLATITAGSTAVLGLGLEFQGAIRYGGSDHASTYARGAAVIGIDVDSGTWLWESAIHGDSTGWDGVHVAAVPDGGFVAAATGAVGEEGFGVAAIATAMNGETGTPLWAAREIGPGTPYAWPISVHVTDNQTAYLAGGYSNPGERDWGDFIVAFNPSTGVAADELAFIANGFGSRSAAFAGAGALSTITSFDDTTAFRLGVDESAFERLIAGDNEVAWAQVANPLRLPLDTGIDVPVGVEVTDTTLRVGDEQLVKRGGGRLILNLANTHSGGTVVEEGLVVVRNVAALGTGTLDVRSGATVRLEVGFGTVALPRLALAAGAILDLGEAKLTIGPGGADEATIRQWIVAGRNGGAWTGTSGIRSRAAAAASGSRTVGYIVRPDGSATVVFTSIGDLDLDRDVDVFDLLAMSTGGRYGQNAAATWSQGDVNYDGRAAVFDLVGINTGGRYGRGSIVTAAAATATAATTEPATATLSPTARTSAFAHLATGIAWEALADGVEEEGSASSKKRSS